MIVCSFARTGATRYCMDLADREGLRFAGELAPTYLEHVGGGKAGIKNEIHECDSQLVLTPEKFCDGIRVHADSVWLVNKGAYLLAPDADVIILRKDLKASLMSFCNLISRLKHTPTAEVTLFYASSARWCNAVLLYLYPARSRHR